MLAEMPSGHSSFRSATWWRPARKPLGERPEGAALAVLKPGGGPGRGKVGVPRLAVGLQIFATRLSGVDLLQQPCAL
jgi:hypothetical protein